MSTCNLPRMVVVAVVFALGAAFGPALVSNAVAQTSQPFGKEKVETREFRNKDVEKALNARRNAGHAHNHNHGHGEKAHRGRGH